MPGIIDLLGNSGRTGPQDASRPASCSEQIAWVLSCAVSIQGRRVRSLPGLLHRPSDTQSEPLLFHFTPIVSCPPAVHCVRGLALFFQCLRKGAGRSPQSFSFSQLILVAPGDRIILEFLQKQSVYPCT